MKKEQSYIVTVPNRPNAFVASIVNNIQKKSNKKETDILIEIRDKFQIFNNSTPVLESDLQPLKQFAEDGGFQLNIERIKRKYTRRTPVVKEEEKTKEEERFGCHVGLNTIINSVPNSKGTEFHYKIVLLNQNNVEMQSLRFPNSRPARYTISQFNRYLYERQFIVVNTTPEIEARIGVFTNVVKKENFKKTNGNGSLSNVYQFAVKKNGSSPNIQVSPGFTYNCQLSIIGPMNSLIVNSSDLRAQLLEIQKIDGRRLLLCDLNKSYFDKLQTIITNKEVYQSVQPYKSSNGSSMVICILNLSKL